MTRNDNLWIEDLFAAGVCDWTPPSERHSLRLLFAPVSHDTELSARCGSILSPAELSKAETFLTQNLRDHFKQQRAFRRYCGAVALGSAQRLSQIEFEETEKGQPFLPQRPDICFSFASCRFGFLGAWSSTHDIGVDIEDRTRSLELAELAEGYFSKAEAAAVQCADGPARNSAFFRLWTLKEAALKSIGEGLPFGLDMFEFALAPDLRIVQAPEDQGGPGRFQAHVIEVENYCAAVVMAQRKRSERKLASAMDLAAAG